MAPLTQLCTPTSADALLAAYQQRAASAPPGSDDDWRRDHLGASLIGHECDRFLWLSFRWAANPNHDGQQLRLFTRGKREEAWIVDDLKAAGFTVRAVDEQTGEQFRVVFHGGHIGGGLDGLVSGLLEAPKAEHVLEVKTHNAKSFGKLKKDGLKRAKPQHWAQCQVYMRGRGLDRAYYVAVCKDNDELYTERVKLDAAAADGLLARAAAVVDMPEPPPRKVESEFPPCVYTTSEGVRYPCQFYDLCHGDGVMPAKNCRTCVSSTPRGDGSWHCSLTDGALTPTMQRFGCDSHLSIPTLINAQVVSVDDASRRIVYAAAGGRGFVDGGGA